MKHAFFERLMHYYHFVAEQVEAVGAETVTSTQIAALMHMDDTLVRKDLAAIGVRGVPHIGFKTADILNTIRSLLGFEEQHRAVVLGAGRLGGAMAAYHGFARYGLQVSALFDAHPDRIGAMVGRHKVKPIEDLTAVVRDAGIDIAILTVPVEVAQDVATQAVEAGVKTLWNFASTTVKAPEGVFVRHEHISVGLAEITYWLKQNADA